MKKSLLLTLFFVAVAVCVISAQTSSNSPLSTDRDAGRPGLRSPASSTAINAEKTESLKKRIREGTTFRNKRCLFRISGNRIALFSEDETERFICVENLNLERVMKSVQENPTQLIWNVDGFYTEYLGENFAYIQRVALAPSKPPMKNGSVQDNSR